MLVVSVSTSAGGPIFVSRRDSGVEDKEPGVVCDRYLAEERCLTVSTDGIGGKNNLRDTNAVNEGTFLACSSLFSVFLTHSSPLCILCRDCVTRLRDG